MAEEKMSDAKKPVWRRGRMLARFMRFAHKPLYKCVAAQLALTEGDEFIEIGYGAGLFIKNFASNVKMAEKSGFFLYSGDEIIRMTKKAGFRECYRGRRFEVT